MAKNKTKAKAVQNNAAKTQAKIDMMNAKTANAIKKQNAKAKNQHQKRRDKIDKIQADANRRTAGAKEAGKTARVAAVSSGASGAVSDVAKTDTAVATALSQNATSNNAWNSLISPTVEEGNSGSGTAGQYGANYSQAPDRK